MACGSTLKNASVILDQNWSCTRFTASKDLQLGKLEYFRYQNELSTPSYWEKVHYRYAIDDALLYMDDKSALMHNITVVNITVTERCLSTGSDDGR